MHVESPSTMFGANMCYVALRLLGEVMHHIVHYIVHYIVFT